MTIDRQLVQFPFTSGIDTKSDPKVLQARLLSLQNGIFTSPGEIRKRNGYKVLGTVLQAGGNLSTGLGCASFLNEIVQFDGIEAYSYSPALTAWSDKGPITSVNVRMDSVVRSDYTQSNPDAATLNGLRFYAWEDTSRGTVQYSIVDVTSGHFIVQDTLLASGVESPKVLTLGSNWIVVLSTGSALQYYGVSSTTLGFNGPNTIGSTLNVSHPLFDACVYNNTRVFVSWNNSSTGHTLASFAAVAGTVATTVTGSAAATTCIGVFPDINAAKVSVLYSSGTTLNLHSFNPSTTVSLGASVTVDTVTDTFSQVTATTNAGSALIFSGITGVTGVRRIREAITSNYSSFTITELSRSLTLAGKAFSNGTRSYVPTVFSSKLQSTYFLLNDLNTVVAKVANGLAGAFRNPTPLPEASASFEFPVTIVDLLTTQPGTTSLTAGTDTPTYSQQGVSNVRLDFIDPVNAYLSATLGMNLHIGGGFLWMYDGLSPVEHGFHLYPEGVISQVAPFGGSLGVPSGLETVAWDYSSTYEWTDNQGQIHRSAPSVPNRAALGVSASGSTFGFVDNGLGTVIGGITAANEATSFSVASVFSFYGSTTNTSTVVGYNASSSSPGFGNNVADYVTPGTGIADNMAGAIIPTGSIVLTMGAGNLGLDTAAIATNTNALLTLTPRLLFTGTISGSTVTLVDSKNLYFSGITVSGSPVVQVLSTTNLAVGMLVQSGGGHFSSTKIISIGTNSITLASNATSSTNGFVVLYAVYLTGNLTATSGSPNLTSISAGDVAYAATHVGRTIEDGTTNIQAGTTIVSASGTTIVMSKNAAGSSSSVNAFIWNSGDLNLRVGNLLTGPISTLFQPNTFIASLSTGIANLSSSCTTTVVGAASLYVTNLAAVYNTIPTLRVTAKQLTDTVTGGRAPISIVTYRTQGNQSVFYRDSAVTTPLFNITSVDSLSFVDSTPDVNLISAPTLYTTGGVLENIDPGPVSALATYKNRILALDSTDLLKIWFSKQVIAGSPVEFSDFQILHADPLGGDVTGVSSMDDKLIIFKETCIFVMTGTGPDITGGQNDFSPMILIATDSGCVNPRSIVLTPNGLMFQSMKGIMLLDRSLGVHYIGAPVEEFNSNVIRSALLIENTNQVRFALDSGTALVYDYAVQQWSTFTSHDQSNACMWQNQYTQCKGTGDVWQETPGLFLDAGAFIPFALTTSWLQFAGLQGFQRARRFLILGEWDSPHNLNIGVAYDFAASATQTDTASFPVQVIPYQTLVHLETQKSEAVQVTLGDSAQSGTGESMRLTGLTFEVGVKRGAFKKPASNQVG